MKEQNITIDYNKILDTALKGVQRAAVFMGFGVNAASNPQFNNYSLTNVTMIQLIPDNLDTSKINEFKEFFLSWIVGCGLRELIETFGIFLDQICNVSLYIKVYKGNLTNKIASKLYHKFIYKGIKEKFEYLEKEFSIKYEYSNYIGTINLARNCLTHRRGVISKKDCNDNSGLKLKWRALDIIAVSKNGNERKLDFPTSESYVCEEGTKIVAKNVDRDITFKLGEPIKIDPRSLAEQCLFITFAAKEVKNSAFDYAIRSGISAKKLGEN